MKPAIFYSVAGAAIALSVLIFQQPQPQPNIEATAQAVAAAAVATHVAEYHATPGLPDELLPAPELLAPVPNDTIYARSDTLFPARFRWKWDGELPPNRMFELRIWRDGRDPVSLGAYDVRDARIIASIGEEEGEREKGTQYLIYYEGDGLYRLDFNPAGVQVVTPEYTTYVWTVALVQITPYQRVGAEASPRPVNVQVVSPPTATPSVVR